MTHILLVIWAASTVVVAGFLIYIFFSGDTDTLKYDDAKPEDRYERDALKAARAIYRTMSPNHQLLLGALIVLSALILAPLWPLALFAGFGTLTHKIFGGPGPK